MAKKKHVNPFYILLVIAGAAFAITAFAYGVMTVRQLQASRMAGYDPPADASEKSLYASADNDRFSEIVSKYGGQLMVGELILLTIGTVGAIAYDQRLDRQEEQEKDNATPTTEGRVL